MPQVILLNLPNEGNIEDNTSFIFYTTALLNDDDGNPCEGVSIRVQFPLNATPAQIETAIRDSMIEGALSKGVVVTGSDCIFPDLKRGKD